jgi:DNA polymerase-3 subunit beta
MKFTFSQAAMVKGIQRVMGAVSTKVPMPSLSNLHLKLDGRLLFITATDLEITMTSTVELLEAEGSGGVLVQAKRLQELIRELPDVPLELEVQEPHKTILKGDGIGVYTLPGGDPIDFPELPVVESKVTIPMSGEVFKRMVSKTIFAVSHDEMRPVLTGMLLQLRTGEIRMVATDGHRLSKVSRHDIEYNGEPRDDIIPMKALNMLMRNIEDDEEVTIGLAETRASFKTSGQSLITRLIDGHYPKYESVIPTANPNRLTVKISDLMSTVRRLSIFTSPISRQIKVSVDGSKLLADAEDPEYGGRGQEELIIDYTGEALEIAYNASYLMDSLRQIDTEDVCFDFGSASDAAIIRPSTQIDKEEFLMLLMPIRLR